MAVRSQKFTYGELGIVNMSVRANAVRASARWRRGAVYLTIPPTMTADEVMKLLEQFKPRLLAVRPGTGHYDGERIEYHDFALTVTSRSLTTGCMEIAKGKGANEYIICAGTALTAGTSDADALIDNLILSFAQSQMRPLFERARATANRLGCSVKEWRTGHGVNRLGSCSSRGVITLSKRVVLLPVELQHYVVCHELAHLTHFDHSSAFHHLLDSYLAGRERELTAALRKWLRSHPI